MSNDNRIDDLITHMNNHNSNLLDSLKAMHAWIAELEKTIQLQQAEIQRLKGSIHTIHSLLGQLNDIKAEKHHTHEESSK
jgi:septal ring factor EnvC (AmiA/AmiB activator)